MKRIIAVIMVLTSVMMLSGCSDTLYLGCVGLYIKKEPKSWNEEKAKTIAQSYLEEKYDEEFIYVTASDSVPSRQWPEDLIVVCHFIRKDDEEVEDPMEYHVHVDYKSREYTVVGDDYMFVHIRKVAEDFLRPYVEKRFSDIEFVFFIYRTSESKYLADAEIPRSFDELCDVTRKIEFCIIVPISEDQNKVSEACRLLRRDLEELNSEILSGYIKVYWDDDFAEVSQLPDPRRAERKTTAKLWTIM